MIIRIFKVKIPKDMQQEFEAKFKEISAPVVQKFKGLLSLEIGSPTRWNPEDYVMISRWESEEDLIVFAGENWNEAHIPKGMEKFGREYSVSHYLEIQR